MYYCPNRKLALVTARISRGIYRCQKCAALVGPKMIDIDHVVKVTPKGGLNTGDDYGKFVHNLFFCGIEGLVALCKPCHAIKTKEEKIETAKKKTKRRPAKVNRKRIRGIKKLRPKRTN